MFSVMGKDSKKKEPAAKGKGKQAAGASDEGGSKDKGGGKGDKLGTCNFVKGRLHPLGISFSLAMNAMLFLMLLISPF